MLARARVSIGAVPSGAALSVQFGQGKVHRGVGFQRVLLREARVVLPSLLGRLGRRRGRAVSSGPG